MSDKNLAYAFYGDQQRWFVGVVEETNTDIPKLGRVRVRIHGIHGDRNEVPVSDLPQAQVLIPTTEPGVSGMGRNPYLCVGATVFGMFLDGKASQLPIVFGSIPVIEVPSQEQLENPVGPIIERNVLNASESLNKTGTRVNNNVTIASAAAGGSDTQYTTDGAEYPSSLDTRKQMAWEYFTSAGWPPAAAAGIIGNLVAESRLIPVAKGDIGLHAPTDVSIGIAQWYSGGGRDKLLIAFAQARGKLWSDYRTQLEFINHELNNYSYLGAGDLRSASTATEAALIFQRKYEIPALTGGLSPIDGKPERHAEAARVSAANDIHNTFTRK